MPTNTIKLHCTAYKCHHDFNELNIIDSVNQEYDCHHHSHHHHVHVWYGAIADWAINAIDDCFIVMQYLRACARRARQVDDEHAAACHPVLVYDRSVELQYRLYWPYA